MDENILFKLGLAESEANVYLALASMGSALASNIAKKCNLHRTSVYDALDKLIKKGLVSFVIKENRKYFEASEPERLLKLLDEKQEEISRERNEVNSLIHDLKIKEKPVEEKVHSQIYKGKEGFKTVMEDIIKSGAKEWFLLGGSGKGIELTPYYLPGFLKRVSKAKIKTKIIYANTEEARVFSKKKDKIVGQETRFLPPEIKNITVIHIYADRVALIPLPSENEELVIFLTKNQKMANSFKDYFNYLWKLSK